MPVARLKVDLEVQGQGSIRVSHLVSASFDESGYLDHYELATATTDQAFPISTTTGVATIQAFYIFSDQTITIRQVAGDTGESITANRPYIVFGTSRTALLLSNASGSTANVRIWAAGT